MNVSGCADTEFDADEVHRYSQEIERQQASNGSPVTLESLEETYLAWSWRLVHRYQN